MRTLWRGIVRTIFWSYERMTWQYDVMVAVIVLFVLLTPRHWFHDQPPSVTVDTTRVELVSEEPSTHTRIYRLEADALPPAQRAARSTPELERQTHDILGRTVGDLQGRTFQVVRIDPTLAGDGSVQYYDVTVHP